MSSNKNTLVETADGQELKIRFLPVAESLNKEFLEHFPAYQSGVVRGEPGGFLMSPEYGQNAQKMLQFKPRTDDVWVISFPKSGTTWTQEMVWMILHDCDEEGAKINLNTRCPFLEFPYFIHMDSLPPPVRDNLTTTDKIDQIPSPRMIKSHLPLYLLHPQLLETSKVVYVARNVKDVIVSYYFHHKLIKIHSFNGSVDEFADYFMKDLVHYAPYFPCVLEAWAKRDHPNMLFLFYEDMKQDLAREIKRVAAFLGKTLSEEQVDFLKDHLGLDSFRRNEFVNKEGGKKTGFFNSDGHFIRKGETGDWKNHLSPETSALIDKWIAETLKESDLKFVTEF